MTTAEIHARLAERFGDAVGPLAEAKPDTWAVMKADRAVDVLRFLKHEPGLELDHCDDITAVDWPARNVIEVVYHLFSYRHRHGLVLKVEADRAAPEIPSASSVWKAAVWLERECYDMFGVTFSGHPDLRRILLPDDWQGFPLRKDYAEHGGWHGITNEREDPLVELRRMDEAKLPHLKAPPPKPAAAKATVAGAPGAKPAAPGVPARPVAPAAKGAAPAPAKPTAAAVPATVAAPPPPVAAPVTSVPTPVTVAPATPEVKTEAPAAPPAPAPKPEDK